MYRFFKKMVDENKDDSIPGESLSDNIRRAYEETLKPFHGLASKTVFKVSIHVHALIQELFFKNVNVLFKQIQFLAHLSRRLK